MFAIECSKAETTKAETGNRMVRTLSLVVRAPVASHTAGQTRTLHRMPINKHGRKPGWPFNGQLHGDRGHGSIAIEGLTREVNQQSRSLDPIRTVGNLRAPSGIRLLPARQA